MERWVLPPLSHIISNRRLQRSLRSALTVSTPAGHSNYHIFRHYHLSLSSVNTNYSIHPDRITTSTINVVIVSSRSPEYAEIDSPALKAFIKGEPIPPYATTTLAMRAVREGESEHARDEGAKARK